MATWLQNKSIITVNAVNMLNEVQLGNGSITITKAQVGSTFSTTASLPTMTAIPNPVGDPVIAEKVKVSDGTKVTVVLDNEGVTTPYNICQVGIYATHPSINNGNECLYYIAQCETPSDVMPARATTPVSLSYSFYVKHNATSPVTVVVDPSHIPVATAETVGGIKVGENLTIDENGVLSGVNSFTLPTASATVMGGIKVGTGLSIDGNGVLNALGSISYRVV